MSSAIIDQKVSGEIPDTLYKSINKNFTEREKDIFFLSLITGLSGCFPSAFGLYRGDEVHANLFLSVVGSASGGKSAIKHVRTCLSGIHNYLQEAGDSDDSNSVNPLLFIPADTSAAMVLEHLKINKGNGIILSEEIDTLSVVMGQEWGKAFYTILRHAFHHETISTSRKAEKNFIEIERPRLSLILGGTESQFYNFIPSAENGTFSRFMTYTYSEISEWQGLPNFDENHNLNDFYLDLSSAFLDMYKFYEGREISFVISREQEIRHDDFFKQYHDHIRDSIGGDAISIIRRHGLIAFRIAMVLSLIRNFDLGNNAYKIECSDLDFDNAMKIAHRSIEHTLKLYGDLPIVGTAFPSPQAKSFFDSLEENQELPTKFLVELGMSSGNAERSIKKWLTHFCSQGLLIKVKYGFYLKPG